LIFATFPAKLNREMNIRAKFHSNPFTKYKDIAPGEIIGQRPTRRTTREHDVVVGGIKHFMNFKCTGTCL